MVAKPLNLRPRTTSGLEFVAFEFEFEFEFAFEFEIEFELEFELEFDSELELNQTTFECERGPLFARRRALTSSFQSAPAGTSALFLEGAPTAHWQNWPERESWPARLTNGPAGAEFAFDR